MGKGCVLGLEEGVVCFVVLFVGYLVLVFLLGLCYFVLCIFRVLFFSVVGFDEWV